MSDLQAEGLKRVKEIKDALQRGAKVYVAGELVSDIEVIPSKRSFLVKLEPSGRMMYLSEFLTKVKVVKVE